MSAVAGTAERKQLRDAVRRCLDRSAGPRGFLAERADGDWFDRELLRSLATDIGIAALVVPESDGGAGAEIADVVAVFEELGAGLGPVPLLATIGLATTALLAIERNEAAGELLARIAAGELTATASDVGPLSDAPLMAAADGSGDWRISGRRRVVVEGAGAAVVLVPAIGADPDGGSTLFAVGADGPAVRRHALPAMDLLRGFADVEFVDAPASILGAPGCWSAAGDAAWDLAAVVLAAEQVGGAQRCLDTAVAYVKQRVQFDRPIGSFQVVQHRLVDLLLEVETARSTLLFAADAADAWLRSRDADTRAALTAAASMAKFTCSDAYLTVADETLHLFGGIGFTWEHNAHLHFRRAKTSAALLGSPDAHRDRLAVSAGLSA